MSLKLQTGKIPQNHGIYFFRKGEKILYIGKAVNLRARLRFYFNFKDIRRPGGHPMSKTLVLLREATSLSWKILDSEAEALIREAEIIKKYHPKYNILMRDDKQYFFVGFTKEIYPKIFIIHQKQQKADYIGPFTDGGALRSVLKMLRRVFPYCTCKKSHKHLCLNAKIGRCLGFCCATSEAKQFLETRRSPQSLNGVLSARKIAELRKYQANIAAIKQVLSGKNRSLIKTFKKEVRKLSNAQRYEDAGKIRNQIRALEKIFEHSNIIKQDSLTESAKAIRALKTLLKTKEINRIEAYDIADVYGKFAYGSMSVFQDDQIKKDAYRLFKIKTVHGSNDPAMIREVISRRLKHSEWPYPQVIIIDGGKPQLSAASAVQPPSKIVALTKNKKHIGDHIYIDGKSARISLDQLPSPLKNLILLLNSEAHRFAIFHYRKLHRKSLTQT